MPDTVNLNIPTGSIAGWRSTLEAAKLIYWAARRNGKDENGALADVLDHVLGDPVADDFAKDFDEAVKTLSSKD